MTTATGPTLADLRTPQDESTHFPINLDKLRTLEAVAAGRARRTPDGMDLLAPANRSSSSGGYGSRLGGKVRLLWAAGLAVLDDGDRWQLTVSGVRRTLHARQAYDNNRCG